MRTALRQPDRAPPIAEQTYRTLRDAIVAGELGAGLRLREVELAARLAVSRTPLREALSRLVGDRLVRRLPRGGVEVIDTAPERWDILQMRLALEGCAAGMAALRISAAELDELDRLAKLTASLPLDAVEARVRVNGQFHAALNGAAGCPRLQEMIDRLREFFLNERQLRRLTQAQSRRAMREHRAIVAALRKRDAASAERLLRQHLEGAWRVLVQPGGGVGGPALPGSRARTT